MSDAKKLLQTMDAAVWAKEFMETFGSRKEDIDEGLMIAWFFNAIMTGYDHQRWQLEGKEMPQSISDIDTRMPAGRVLIASLSRITTLPGYTDKTPDETLSEMVKVAEDIYREELQP